MMDPTWKAGCDAHGLQRAGQQGLPGSACWGDTSWSSEDIGLFGVKAARGEPEQADGFVRAADARGISAGLRTMFHAACS